MFKAKGGILGPACRFLLILFALVFLQLSVPLQVTEAFCISSDFVFVEKQPDKSNIWADTKDFLQRCIAKLTTEADTAIALIPKPAPVRSFKIVKTDSRKTDTSSTGYIWPVKGEITSAFGMRNHPVTRKKSFHNGIDIRARQGTSILSPVEGTVVSAGHAGLLGRLVKIRTNSGKTLYFGHMHKIKCLKGQKVSKGCVIGTVGSSGRATGPHLHFSVVSGGKYLNPLSFLSSEKASSH